LDKEISAKRSISVPELGNPPVPDNLISVFPGGAAFVNSQRSSIPDFSNINSCPSQVGFEPIGGKLAGSISTFTGYLTCIFNLLYFLYIFKFFTSIYKIK